MSRRPNHGTYEEERTYFLTTLHAQIDILKDNYQGNREQTIKSLGLLLHRIQGLRMAGQAYYKGDSYLWTDKCNNIYKKIVWFRNILLGDPCSTRRVARDIESLMLFLSFCIPEDIRFHVGSANDRRRGERSAAPSPEGH